MDLDIAKSLSTDDDNELIEECANILADTEASAQCAKDAEELKEPILVSTTTNDLAGDDAAIIDMSDVPEPEVRTAGLMQVAEEEPAVEEPEDEPKSEAKTFVPDDSAARKRIADMVVQTCASMRLRVAKEALTLEEVYAHRQEIIQDRDELEEETKQLMEAILDQAYAAADKLPELDPEDKVSMGSVSLLASGTVKASAAGNLDFGIIRKVLKKRVEKDKRTAKRRNKNKMGATSRKRNKKKKKK